MHPLLIENKIKLCPWLAKYVNSINLHLMRGISPTHLVLQWIVSPCLAPAQSGWSVYAWLSGRNERWIERARERDAVPLKMNDLRRKWQFLGDSRCQESFEGQNTCHSRMDLISTSELPTACQLLWMTLILWSNPENNTIHKLWHNKRCKQKFAAHFQNIMSCTCGRAP